MKINIKEIAVGDVFSEESHYIVEEIGKDTIKFKHTESGKVSNIRLWLCSRPA